MSLITGRNIVTNKINVLNIDDDGKLKIDESGIFYDSYIKLDNLSNSSQDINSKLGLINFDTTEIKNTNDNIKTDLIDRRINLQYQRSLGNCYIASDERQLAAQNSSFYSLLNPTASGKTMYVYGISCVVSDHDSVNIGGVIYIEGFLASNYTKGTNANDGKNLKIGESDSPMEGARDSTISGGTIPLIREAFSFSTTTTQELFRFTHDLTQDMIEIREGYGINFKYTDDTAAAQELDYAVNIKFVVLEN